MFTYVSFLLTAMNCDTLADPPNGQVSHTVGTTLGQRATYSCNTGYNLVGGSIHTCLATGWSGSAPTGWSGSAPTCQGMLFMRGQWGKQLVNFSICSCKPVSILYIIIPCMYTDAQEAQYV